ncbi:hypothetical protein ACFV5J_23450 [Streptomyces zaomyceticus]|uniref:hypothetical protein n=1 Tax=Streptomyces zaomyceticus TaxID=68286 RepID=UPI00364C87D9
MIFKFFKALLGDRAAQQPDAEPQPPAAEPPAPLRPPVEPPAAEVPPAPAPDAPQGPEDALRRMLLRAAADEAVRWLVEEVLPHLF